MKKTFVALVLVLIALAVTSTDVFAYDRGDRRYDRDRRGHVAAASSQIKLSFPGVFVNLDLSNDRRDLVWVPGYWERVRYRGYVWVPGHWEKRVSHYRHYGHSSRQCYADRRCGR